MTSSLDITSDVMLAADDVNASQSSVTTAHEHTFSVRPASRRHDNETLSDTAAAVDEPGVLTASSIAELTTHAHEQLPLLDVAPDAATDSSPSGSQLYQSECSCEAEAEQQPAAVTRCEHEESDSGHHRVNTSDNMPADSDACHEALMSTASDTDRHAQLDTHSSLNQ